MVFGLIEIVHSHPPIEAIHRSYLTDYQFAYLFYLSISVWCAFYVNVLPKMFVVNGQSSADPKGKHSDATNTHLAKP